jgi:recombination protein RecR
VEYSSKTLEQLVEAFSRLPGIGRKSAQRIALYLLREGRNEAEHLAKAIVEMIDKIGNCSICFNLTEEDPCLYCRDSHRDKHVICVVEDPKDLLIIEKTGNYRGQYHILGGVLSPLDGIGAEALKIKELLDRITPEIREVIVATNPTVEGEMTAAYLALELKSKEIKVTRIARGIPFGGALEFNDAVTVAKAMEGRVEL